MKNVFAFYKVFKEVLVTARPFHPMRINIPHEDDRAAYGKQSHKIIESVFVFPANLVAARRE